MVLMHRGPLWTIYLLLQAAPGSVIRRLVRLISYRMVATFGGRLFLIETRARMNLYRHIKSDGNL